MQFQTARNKRESFMTPPTLQKCLSRELQEVLNQRNLLTVKSRQKMCHLLDSLSTETEECDKRRSLRRQAVQEIISSEQSYMQQLKILIDFFVRPLESQQIIDTATHGTLFGHIEMMFNLNGELLRELQEDRDCVAGAFLKLAPFFRLYSVYAFDYKKALLRLQELTAKNTAFRQFLANTESRPEVQTKLNSLLIAPIQRVPRYRLLLQQVLLYTSPSDGDFAALQASVKEVETTVEHIDSLVEEQENTQQMINLQNALVSRTPAIIKPGRRLFREGVLEKVSSTGGHLRRHCALMSDIFMYSKILRERSKANLPENSLQCCCIFPLKKTKITELFPGTFRISCQGDGVIFRTLDMLEGQSWVVAMQEAIAMHIEFRKTLRKESSKRRPLRRKKDVRNFESDTILSPRRRGDFENVFRTHVEGADEAADGQKRTCFHLNPVNLLKRRTQERTTHQMPPKKILRQKSPMRDVLFPLREIQEPQDAEDSAGGRETASVRRRVTFEDPPVSRIAMLEESRTSHQYEGIIPRLPNVSSIRDRIVNFLARIF